MSPHRIAAIPGRIRLALSFSAALGIFASPALATTTLASSGSVPHAVTQGETAEGLPRPDELSSHDDVAAVASVDGVELASESSSDLPYQVFTTEHPGGTHPLTWTGTADPAREIVLYGWNAEGEEWEELRRERGTAPEPTVVTAELTDRHETDGLAHVAVLGSDPFDLPEQQTVTGRFEDPADYDFGIAHLTDTQFLSEGAADESLDGTERERFAEAYRGMTQWVADNAASRKIAYAAHTGDLIENYIWPHHTPAEARPEFEFASEAQRILDDAGVPNGVLPGNHDNKWGLAGNALYNEYFGPERYEEISQRWENASYGGPWREGDNAHHYDLFSAGGQDFIAVHLGYGHDRAAQDWANEVLEQHRDRDAIILTHAYLDASGRADGAAEGYGLGVGAQGLRTRVVEPNENVFLVLSGHYHGVAWNVNRADPNRPAVELLADYQNYEVDGERSTGFLRFLQFDLDAGEMKVNTYSPRLDEHGATEYDTEAGREYQESVDEFTVPVNLRSRITSFGTDQLLLGTVPAPGSTPTQPDAEPTSEPTTTSAPSPTTQPTAEPTSGATETAPSTVPTAEPTTTATPDPTTGPSSPTAEPSSPPVDETTDAPSSRPGDTPATSTTTPGADIGATPDPDGPLPEVEGPEDSPGPPSSEEEAPAADDAERQSAEAEAPGAEAAPGGDSESPAADAGKPLPRTGEEVTGALVLGALLLLAGSASIMIARRRR